MIHFGINFKKSKFGFSLTRENYIHPSKKSSFNNTEYDDEYIISHTKRALFNFDLNMRFFLNLIAKNSIARLRIFLGNIRNS